MARRQNHEQQGPQQVKLHLHGKRPEVRKASHPFPRAHDLEVCGENKMRRPACESPVEAQQHRHRHNRVTDRDQPRETLHVIAGQIQLRPLRCGVFARLAGEKIARKKEKQLHPENSPREAAPQTRKPEMVEDNQHHRQPANAVDLCLSAVGTLGNRFQSI
jgi:hypothetical protein